MDGISASSQKLKRIEITTVALREMLEAAGHEVPVTPKMQVVGPEDGQILALTWRDRT